MRHFGTADRTVDADNLQRVIDELEKAYPPKAAKPRDPMADAQAELDRWHAETARERAEAKAAAAAEQAKKDSDALIAKFDAAFPGAREAEDAEAERQRLIQIAEYNNRYIARP